ncbi:carboxypeptidase D, partial [Elysia marginata]
YTPVTRPVLVHENSPTDQTIVLKAESDQSRTIDYHSPDQVADALANLSTQFPDYARRSSIGKSALNSDIWMLQLGLSYDKARILPGILFVGNMHGDEAVSREVLLKLAAHLCRQYKEDDYMRNVLNETHIYLIPSANPDGAKLSEPNCATGKGHVNAAGVDLDGNFLSDYPKDQAVEQAETKAIKKALKETGAQVVVYVGSGDTVVSYIGPADKTLANAYINGRQGSSELEKSCEDHQGKEYLSQIVGFSDFFDHSGAFLSYVHRELHRGSVLVNTGCCRYPSPDQLTQMWKWTRPSLMSLIREARKGLFGMVMDEGTNRPLAGAKIHVSPAGYSQVSDENGLFAVYLPSGTFTFHTEAAGYKTKHQEVHVLVSTSARELVIKMLPNTLLFGMSPMVSVIVIACVVMVIVLFVTGALCLRKSGRMPYDEMGFKQLTNDDSDSDDVDYELSDRKKFIKTQQRTNGTKEYHDEVSTEDEDGEHSLFEKRLI